MSCFPPSKGEKTPSNYHSIYLDIPKADEVLKMLTEVVKNPHNTNGLSILQFGTIISAMTERNDNVLQHPKMQNLMHSGQKFDLVIIGWVFNEYHLGIAGHYRCPSVMLSTIPAMKPMRDLTGSPTGVASVPILPEGLCVEPTSFWGRVLRFLFYFLEWIACTVADLFIHESHYNKHFPAGEGYPTYDEVKKNVSLVLINHHFSQGGVRPYLPSMVEVSGLQIKTRPDPLPQVQVNLCSQIHLSVQTNSNEHKFICISGNRYIFGQRQRTWSYFIFIGIQCQHFRHYAREAICIFRRILKIETEHRYEMGN